MLSYSLIAATKKGKEIPEVTHSIIHWLLVELFSSGVHNNGRVDIVSDPSGSAFCV